LDRKHLERAFDSAPTLVVARTLLLAIRNLMHWAVNERLIEADGNRQARRSVQRQSGSNGGGRVTHPPNDHR
jgi:hypothetical protein